MTHTNRSSTLGFSQLVAQRASSPDHNSNCRTPHTHRFAAADGNRHWWKFRFRVKSAQFAKNLLKALTDMGQNRRAVFGVCVSLRTLCQGFGNPASRDVSHLREFMKPVRTGIEIKIGRASCRERV